VVTDQSAADDAELKKTIDAFDRAFSEGRLGEFLAFFADDAQLLIHQQETVIGKEAIRDSFGPGLRGFRHLGLSAAVRDHQRARQPGVRPGLLR
jgi:ketosteroid isomerase-like protein